MTCPSVSLSFEQSLTSACAAECAQRMVSARELAYSRGAGGGPIYLAVLGQVFDVSRGRKHYGTPTAGIVHDECALEWLALLHKITLRGLDAPAGPLIYG